MVTREEVAQRAGVSTMTVTRVVTGRGYVSDATRRKVRKVIDQLGYIPNKIASGLVSGKSNRIAIVVPDLTNPYYLQVVGAMIEEAKRDDYVISVYKANEEEPDLQPRRGRRQLRVRISREICPPSGRNRRAADPHFLRRGRFQDGAHL